MPAELGLRVDTNVPDNTSDVRVIANDGAVAVFRDERALVWVMELGPGQLYVHLDPRPIGLAIYVEPDGLHIGEAVFARNTISGADTAISLG